MKDAVNAARAAKKAKAAEEAAKAAKAAEDAAKSPVGKEGKPMNASGNKPDTISGRDYTGHALDEMQSEGIMPSVVENAIKNGASAAGNTAGTTVFSDAVNGISVVVDSASGRVITTYIKH